GRAHSDGGPIRGCRWAVMPRIQRWRVRMTTCPSPRVLFRIAAGPRIGFGHLVRCRSLARVLGCDPIASVRGTAQRRALSGSMGWRVVEGAVAFAIDRVEPDVIVIDDPSSGDAATAVRRAR